MTSLEPMAIICCVIFGSCLVGADTATMNITVNAYVPPVLNFDYQGVALHYDDLQYMPRNDLVHPSIIKAADHIANPLGTYYMYFSPHVHTGIFMAYSDSMDGPWVEHGTNLISGAAAPDIRWIEEAGTYYMWAHTSNGHTDMWSSTNGIDFTFEGIAVHKDNIGSKNATYTRVYEHGIEGIGNKYIMLYTALDLSIDIRSTWLAVSDDAITWFQDTEPLVMPAAGENDAIYGSSFLRMNNKNYIFYEDNSSGNSGGNVKYVLVDDAFTPVGSGGERVLLMDPPTGDPADDRYRGGEFYHEDDTMYYFSGAGRKYREVIVYFTAYLPPAVPTQPSPGDGDTVLVSGSLPLSWTNIAPNGQPLFVDVLFGTEPDEALAGYDMALVVDNIEDADTVNVDASGAGTYYWRVDNTIGDADTVVGKVWSFTTTNDPAPTVEIHTPAMMTWSDNSVTLDATITDSGSSLLTYGWTAVPDGIGNPNITVDFDAGAEDPEVTVTNLTGSMVTVSMTLIAFDDAHPGESAEASVEIDVYPDACEMAKNGLGTPVAATDFNADCITDLLDLVEMVSAWLDDYAATEAVDR